jgi:hypothetical protein
MSSWRRHCLGFALGAAFAAGAVHSQAPAPAAARPAGTIHALEQAIETRSDAVALPSGGVGAVTVTPCAKCRPVTMLAGTASVWMLGDRPVAFDELRRALQAHPRAPVLVFYRGAGAGLTRLIAQVPGTSAP